MAASDNRIQPTQHEHDPTSGAAWYGRRLPESARRRFPHAPVGLLRESFRCLPTEIRSVPNDLPGAAFVRRHIADKPGCSLDEAVRRTLTTQSAASDVVARLVAQGFVRSVPAQRDRRRVALTVTALGSRVTRESAPPIQDALVAA